ncbi:hypothetical protein J8J14_10815 [Roseomonas sp. SSH11]|uniref:Uncharacterized protein n=1 Tax=Pararoseomonas baculiformis TaxID=2820812 RepID=A0ABS4AGC6_9PROT|nr:hypothetical protein [Pararoseomonas baculiformis]MBP0445269.1 hypothetical protein [Pararoseomonas baculiformis]
MPKNDDPTELEPRPVPAPLTRTANVAQLKRDIESGATGDKVPMLDPGLSPLGTDDEAAGAPPDPKLVAEVRERERRDAPIPPDAASHAQRVGPSSGHRMLAIAVGVACLALLVAVLIWRM